MPPDDALPDQKAIIAEYKTIRAEILHLNNQFLKILIWSVGINLTVLGWLFSNKDLLENIFVLLLICVFILFFGCILLINRDRLAHRLAIFQELFIEKRISVIYWARAYTRYKNAFGNRWQSQLVERFAESGLIVLMSFQLLDLIIFVYYAIIPWLKYGLKEIDWNKLIFFIIMLIFFLLTIVIFRKVASKYDDIDNAMRQAADELFANTSTPKTKT